jgi:lipopolysaccharide/colanic/teichoic acid biosynthesis glycosyltransferase
MLKRLIDVAFSASLLLMFALPIAVISMVLLVLQGGPVFFRQRRPGYLEMPFMLIKFRTMTTDPNETEARDTRTPDAVRLTSFGRWLRETSLDELPSLWNVVRGDMSLVGPRPLLMHYLPLYDDVQRRRHLVRPGITGWAQIHGRNRLPWTERLRLDVWYVENMSAWLDITILARTLFKIAVREGATAPGGPTSDPFQGSGKK